MLHIKSLALALTFGLMATAQGNAAEKYAYDSVPGDPLHAKIYTLPNGLKIFMSQNPRSPRIQANIAVRVGGHRRLGNQRLHLDRRDLLRGGNPLQRARALGHSTGR